MFTEKSSKVSKFLNYSRTLWEVDTRIVILLYKINHIGLRFRDAFLIK